MEKMPLYDSAGCPMTALLNHGNRAEVVGSKRKVTDGTNCCNGGPAVSEHAMCPLKRQCLEGHYGSIGEISMLSSEELSCTRSCASSHPPLLPAASLQQEHTPSVFGCLKDVITRCSLATDTGISAQESAILTPSSETQRVIMEFTNNHSVNAGQNLQEAMWMDMDGETYNSLDHIDLDYGILTMETDSCPNLAQYGV